MENGWHLTKKVGGFCLQFILLTLICAYVCDTRVRVFPLFRGLVFEPRRPSPGM